jgi:hypothetical protein
MAEIFQGDAMNDLLPAYGLMFFKENDLEMPPPPFFGPDGYTRRINATWRHRSQDQFSRVLNDERNHPVNNWFRLGDENEG